jgi:hypothetical protein
MGRSVAASLSRKINVKPNLRLPDVAVPKV